jgi:hypothetical protein
MIRPWAPQRKLAGRRNIADLSVILEEEHIGLRFGNFKIIFLVVNASKNAIAFAFDLKG